MRALRVPLDTDAVDEALRGEPELRDLAGAGSPRAARARARARARRRGPEPDPRSGSPRRSSRSSPGAHRPALDALVVARPARPQQGETQDFLTGLYGGLAAAPIPSVGVDVQGDAGERAAVFRRRGLSTVDTIDTATGQVALVYLLGGARPGSYGIGGGAVDGVLPDPPPLPTPTEG